MSLFSPVTQHLESNKYWYMRRAGVMRGPFSAENISSYILLGRIRLDDELSQDCENWSAASSLGSLFPNVPENQSSWDDYEQLVIAHMKADERSSDRRGQNDSSYADSHRERRIARNRRSAGGNTLLSRYLFPGAMSLDGNRHDARRRRLLLLIVLLVSLMFAWLNPIQQ